MSRSRFSRAEYGRARASPRARLTNCALPFAVGIVWVAAALGAPDGQFARRGEERVSELHDRRDFGLPVVSPALFILFVASMTALSQAAKLSALFLLGIAGLVVPSWIAGALAEIGTPMSVVFALTSPIPMGWIAATVQLGRCLGILRDWNYADADTGGAGPRS